MSHTDNDLADVAGGGYNTYVDQAEAWLGGIRVSSGEEDDADLDDAQLDEISSLSDDEPEDPSQGFSTPRPPREQDDPSRRSSQADEEDGLYPMQIMELLSQLPSSAAGGGRTTYSGSIHEFDPSTASILDEVAAAGDDWYPAGSSGDTPSKDGSGHTSMAGLNRLQIAESREHRLLESGSGEIVTVVDPDIAGSEHARRRRSQAGSVSSHDGHVLVLMRKPTPTRPSQLDTGKDNETEHVSVWGTRGMKKITEDLKASAANASAPGVVIGSGAASCIAVSSKFIAIGCARGTVRVYDHYEKLHNCLTPEGKSKISDGAVTSLDFNSAGDTLVVGYTSGRVSLFNVVTGKALKSTTDFHTAKIFSVRFCSSSASDSSHRIVSVDHRGSVFLLTFSKFLRWTVNAVCILKPSRKIGPIFAISVLRLHEIPAVKAALSRADGSTGSARSVQVEMSDASCLAIAKAGTLVALSASSSTFIVATDPEPVVLFRWDRPVDVPASSLPTLSWGWGRVSGTVYTAGGTSSVVSDDSDGLFGQPPGQRAAELPTIGVGFAGPVLARGWGHRLELLQAQPPRGYTTETVVGPPRRGPGSIVSSYTASVDGSLALSSSGGGGGGTSLPASGASTKGAAFSKLLKFVLTDECEASEPIVAVTWITDQMLAYYTEEGNVVASDTTSMEEIDRIPIADKQLAYAEFLCYAKPRSEGLEGPPDSASLDVMEYTLRQYQECFRSESSSLHLLGFSGYTIMRARTWSERAMALMTSGDSIHALAIAIQHYVALKKRTLAAIDVAERRARRLALKNNTDHDPTKFNALRMVPVPRYIRDEMLNLLKSYIDHNFTGREPSTEVTTEEKADTPTSALASRTSHDPMYIIASACADFCVHTDQIEVFFGDVYQRFLGAQEERHFYEALQPNIIRDRITTVPPDVLKGFVEHFNELAKKEASVVESKSIATVERCLLHLNTTTLDLNQTIKLCVRHKLFSALTHIFNDGVSDYTTPLDLLLVAVADSPPKPRFQDQWELSDYLQCFKRPKQESKSEKSILGYKLLFYLQLCFTGRKFPEGDLSPEKKNMVRNTILAALFERNPSRERGKFPSFDVNLLHRVEERPTKSSEGTTRRRSSSGSIAANWGNVGLQCMEKLPGPFPRVQALGLFDMQTFLTVLDQIFSIVTSERILAHEEEDDPNATEHKLDSDEDVAMPLQSIIQALSDSILPHGRRGTRFGKMLYTSLNRMAPLSPGVETVEMFSDEDISRFLSFVLRQVAQKNSIVTVSEELHDIIVRSLLFRRGGEDKAEMLTLVHFLQRFPLPAHRARDILPLIEDAEFWRAAVVIHKQQGNYEAAIMAYLRDKDPVYRGEVFAYIRDLLESAEHGVEPEKGPSLPQLKEMIFQTLEGLVEVDADESATLSQHLFKTREDHERVIDQLKRPELQLKYLRQLIGTLESNGVKRDLGWEVSDRMYGVYIRCLTEIPTETANIYPCLVNCFDYLPLSETTEFLEEKLRKSRDSSTTSNLSIAFAYMLERTGNRTAALHSMLNDLGVQLGHLAQDLESAMAGPAARDKAQPARTSEPLIGHQVTGYSTRQQVLVDCLKACAPAGEYCRDRLNSVLNALQFCIDLCERAEQGQDAKSLWFRLLRLVVQRQSDPLKEGQPYGIELEDSRVQRRKSTMPGLYDSDDEEKGNDEAEERFVSNPARWDFALSDAWRRVCSSLIRYILDSIKGSLPLNVVIETIIDDHADEEFREFRSTILSMLDSYHYETRIQKTADKLMKDHLLEETHSLVKKRKSAMTVRTYTCAACHQPLLRYQGGNQAEDVIIGHPGLPYHLSCYRSRTRVDEPMAEDSKLQQLAKDLRMENLRPVFDSPRGGRRGGGGEGGNPFG